MLCLFVCVCVCVCVCGTCVCCVCVDDSESEAKLWTSLEMMYVCIYGCMCCLIERERKCVMRACEVLCMYVYMYVCMYVCMLQCRHIYANLCMTICMQAYTCHESKAQHLYMFNIYIHTYIHTYMICERMYDDV